MKEIGKETEGLYILRLQEAESYTEKALAVSKSESIDTDLKNKGEDNISLWHRRLGHVPPMILKKLFTIKHDNCVNVVKNCHVCPLAKHTRLPFPSSNIKSTNYFELLHADVWGPIGYQHLMEIDTS